MKSQRAKSIHKGSAVVAVPPHRFSLSFSLSLSFFVLFVSNFQKECDKENPHNICFGISAVGPKDFTYNPCREHSCVCVCVCVKKMRRGAE